LWVKLLIYFKSTKIPKDSQKPSDSPNRKNLKELLRAFEVPSSTLTFPESL